MTTTILSSLEPLWQHAAGQSFPKSTLYVVATPIGNLSDITVRALYVLSLCDVIACEDTRHSKPLLQQYGITTNLISVHQHNEDEAASSLINRLHAGERVALISDAGTPAVSDPGARVVAAVRAAGFNVVPLAGASAVVTAMSGAGLEGGFLFEGFLPNKSQARASRLEVLAHVDAHLVFYEAPHRLLATIEAMAAVFMDRQLVVVKELSKLHEKFTLINMADVSGWLASEGAPRGEYLLIVSAPPKGASAAGVEPLWQKTVEVLLEELPLKQAVALAVKLTGAQKNAVYAYALNLKNAD